MEKELTKRGIIYTNWNCTLDCPFCYFRFKPKHERPLRDIKADLIKARYYYNLLEVDISGGEPTICKHIIEVLKYCKIIGLKATVITNGLTITKEIDDLADEWMISIHGTKDIHDKCVNRKVFHVLEKNLKKIQKPYRVNVVVTKDNFKNFPKHALYLTKLEKKPTRVHYIMFNPFHEFTHEAKIDFMPNPMEVGEYLEEAVNTLENNGIGVVVRYLPFCMAKNFKKNICGMTQVAWDFGEWDWCQQLNMDARARNVQNYYKISRNTVLQNSCNMPECRECSAELICDGVSVSYLKHFKNLKLEPIKGEKIFDPLHFKK